MKNSSLKNGIITGLVAFLTIGLLSIGYATLSSGLSLSDKVGTGSGLSSSSWNKIVDSILELDGKVSKITYVEGTIGTSSPITLPYSTSTYTQNSITLPPGKWQITMIAPVHGNNF